MTELETNKKRSRLGINHKHTKDVDAEVRRKMAVKISAKQE